MPSCSCCLPSCGLVQPLREWSPFPLPGPLLAPTGLPSPGLLQDRAHPAERAPPALALAGPCLPDARTLVPAPSPSLLRPRPRLSVRVDSQPHEGRHTEKPSAQRLRGMFVKAGQICSQGSEGRALGPERKRAFQGSRDELGGAGMGRAGRRPINTSAPTALPPAPQSGCTQERLSCSHCGAVFEAAPALPAPGGRCCLGTNALYEWAVLEEGSTFSNWDRPPHFRIDPGASSLLAMSALQGA